MYNYNERKKCIFFLQQKNPYIIIAGALMPLRKQKTNKKKNSFMKNTTMAAANANNNTILNKIISYNGYGNQLTVNDLLGVSYDDLLTEINKIQNGWRTLNGIIIETNLQIGDIYLNIDLTYSVKSTREINGNKAIVSETYTYTLNVFGNKKCATRELNLPDRYESTLVNAITDAIFESLDLTDLKRSLNAITWYNRCFDFPDITIKEWLGGTSTSAISRKMNKFQYGVIAKGAYTLPGGIVCQTELEYNKEQDANGFWGSVLRVKCVCGQYTAYDNVDTESELLSFTDYIDIAIRKAGKNAVQQYVNAIVTAATAA
jgi:hypothetical protein